MKNNKLITLILILIIGLTIQTTKVVISNDRKDYKDAEEAGFESEELYQCILETLEKDDDSVTDEELKTITKLKCNEAGIESTAGLEKLTELTDLQLSNNDISEIDLSENTKLEHLVLAHNNIESLDLTNNDKLIGINLSNNPISDIDLPENSGSIKQLYLSDTSIVDGDFLKKGIKKLINLEELNLDTDYIEEIDLSQNTKLKVLTAYNNMIGEIDLSHNIALVDLNLRDNYLEEIDISALTALKRLNLSTINITELDLSHNNALESLIIQFTNIEEIDISNLTNLKELNIAYSEIQEIEIPDKSKLVYLAATYDEVKDMDFEEYPSLTKLDIIHFDTINVAGEEVAVSEIIKRIPEGIELNNHAVYPHILDASVCDTTDDGMEAITFDNTNDLFNRHSIDCGDVITGGKLSSDYSLIQIRSTDFDTDLEIPDGVTTKFNAIYALNFLEVDPDSPISEDEDGNQVITNVPDTGVTIINIVLFGITILITGFYIISRAVQTKKVRND